MNALFLTLTSLVALAIADADAVGRNADSPCGDAQTNNASADNIKAANVTADDSRCGAAGIPPVPSIDPAHIPYIAALAGRQRMENLVYTGLLRAGISEDTEGMKPLLRAAFGNALQCERQNADFDRISAAFQQAGVDHLPLKGLASRELYQSIDMRSLSDLDILIRREQLEKACETMTSLGYRAGKVSKYEHVFENGGAAVELHTALLSPENRDFYPYFGDGWGRAKQRDGHLWRYSREDELVYSFVHFTKHYRNGGAGIKFVVDIEEYVRRVPGLDMEYVRGELESLGLVSFFENALRLCRAWFEGGEHDDVTRLMTDCICRGGVFGTRDSEISARIARTADGDMRGASRKRMWQTFFPSLDSMKEIYPFVARAPFLLPVGYAARAFRLLLFRRDRIGRLISDTKSASTDSAQHFVDELHAVGLDICRIDDSDM